MMCVECLWRDGEVGSVYGEVSMCVFGQGRSG